MNRQNLPYRYEMARAHALKVDQPTRDRTERHQEANRYPLDSSSLKIFNPLLNWNVHRWVTDRETVPTEGPVFLLYVYTYFFTEFRHGRTTLRRNMRFMITWYGWLYGIPFSSGCEKDITEARRAAHKSVGVTEEDIESGHRDIREEQRKYIKVYAYREVG